MIQPTSPGLSGRRLYVLVHGRAIPQRHADVAHRVDKPLATASVDGLKQAVDLRPRGGLGGGERLASRGREREQPMLAMFRADPALR